MSGKLTFVVPPAIVHVKLDGKHVGSIRHNEHTGTWSYKPKGSDLRGEEFPTLPACKKSLEDE